MVNLSIIIPHYNSYTSLKCLLLSIPKRDDLEIIVIDDKSDNSVLKKIENFIEELKFNNIILLRNETNKNGAGVCRNLGLKMAKGRWVLFADSDDFFVNGFYDKIREYFNSKYDVIFFSPTSIEIPSKKKSDRHKAYEEIIYNFTIKRDKKSELKLRYCFFVPWSKLINRKFLIKNNIYFDEILASNDIMFSTKVGHLMKCFAVSNDVIYCVTRNKGSLTMNLTEEVFDARLQAYIDYCNFLKSNLNDDEISYFEIKGTGFILNVIKYKLGIKKLISTYNLLRSNNIKVIDKRYLNPIYLFKKLNYHRDIYIKSKKFITRQN